MPRTRECDYCGADIEPGTGTMFVHNDGTTVHFCSSKCENNADLGREARNLGWTEDGRGAGGETRSDEDTAEDEVAEDESGDVAPDLEAAEDEAEADETEEATEESEEDEETEEAEA
ncbi:50S ribosomal protein L24e [Haloarcula nitratireducens]|uniref:Large ribosomal subunit protein eL24 n=1 Tax=Haloarcula nitratireducens TaxID=2487749 RepID=A0AAW4P9P5_9EURY|nr:50S ribosomal protein L24e [Halomicroarcula nitratireducens]MBX0294461.1 50S ribosomal protein L24e [Halomicroarcula nitratireducens]